MYLEPRKLQAAHRVLLPKKARKPKAQPATPERLMAMAAVLHARRNS